MRGLRLRPTPTSKSTRTTKAGVAVLGIALASTLVFGLLAPAAGADELTDRRDEVKQQLAKTKADLNESSAALSAAGVAVDQAQGQLDQARAELSRTRTELAAAKAKDDELAAKLKQAKADLAAAKKAVAAGQAKLDAKKAMAGEMVRDQYQQQTNLLPIAVLTSARSTADFATRLQWSTTMFDTTQARIDELTTIQQQLTAERARQAKLEAQVASDRHDAAVALKTSQQLEARASAQEANVAVLLQQREDVQDSAAADVASDKAQYADLTRERATVEQRIADRIAKAKAEAARQAAAQRAAAQKAAAAARKAAASATKSSSASKARRSTSSKSSAPTRSSRPAASSNDNSNGGAHHGFAYPVSAPITSPYGMRFHPVLHYWKLHDGTDFGAGCGTAIHAPYDGRVAEKYYNAGYGNRLMIDHGLVDGKYVTTGYNHAIRYTVGVGERVSKGEVIGYVGTTGFSTGCHLHLMVWLNGRVVNPMTWY